MSHNIWTTYIKFNPKAWFVMSRHDIQILDLMLSDLTLYNSYMRRYLEHFVKMKMFQDQLSRAAVSGRIQQRTATFHFVVTWYFSIFSFIKSLLSENWWWESKLWNPRYLNTGDASSQLEVEGVYFAWGTLLFIVFSCFHCCSGSQGIRHLVYPTHKCPKILAFIPPLSSWLFCVHVYATR